MCSLLTTEPWLAQFFCGDRVEILLYLANFPQGQGGAARMLLICWTIDSQIDVEYYAVKSPAVIDSMCDDREKCEET